MKQNSRYDRSVANRLLTLLSYAGTSPFCSSCADFLNEGLGTWGTRFNATPRILMWNSLPSISLLTLRPLSARPEMFCEIGQHAHQHASDNCHGTAGVCYCQGIDGPDLAVFGWPTIWPETCWLLLTSKITTVRLKIEQNQLARVI